MSVNLGSERKNKSESCKDLESRRNMAEVLVRMVAKQGHLSVGFMTKHCTHWIDFVYLNFSTSLMVSHHIWHSQSI